MGFAHSLVAVRDLSPAEVAARLGRSLSGEVTDLDTATGRDTPGWCVSPPINRVPGQAGTEAAAGGPAGWSCGDHLRDAGDAWAAERGLRRRGP